VLPEYKVAGREEKFDKKHNSKALAKAAGAMYIHDPKNLKNLLLKAIDGPAIVVMMGAGDIVNYTDKLVK